ncbi:NH(3)-dependent NAD(+) synthetase [Chryseobacterium aquaeductus]|uniref:NH(3)-dependent NAD(+) synthetase n=1 Tax=Chryseobacterium aquaeductus TaxID=2675056 RepID=A0A9N8MD94_9FLAO|nr:NAD(+) synthase [Chryseobacterium aquaeductus]CAA7329671.1 NH(3)-dependent NAD(+) synthetase [Chryseobacterium potabilaquae]CAD7798283.1 NH(3)-dependent NAD(+) synthetase [Chryseobacterium aquaeductus]
MQTKKVIDHIVNWLKDYAIKANVKGYVLGVSGGVDSGVVSTLCAMTGLEVLLLEMPIRQKQDQVNRAQAHIEDLKKRFPNVTGKTINLTPVFESFENVVHDHVEGRWSNNLALANTRSRFRMLNLYYFGQLHGLLVCGTGNKVEDFGIGFYTKYGDGGVDVSPIADLYKTEVYQLAKDLNLIESIQNAIPTDGLWDAERTDEDQIGATYPELEKIQKEWGSKIEADYTGRDLEVFKIFSRMNKTAQHKMVPIPICDIPEEWRN